MITIIVPKQIVVNEGYKNSIRLALMVRASNNTGSDLYLKIYFGDYGDQEFGLASAGQVTTKVLYFDVPIQNVTSPTDETVDVKVEAYSDDQYTNLVDSHTVQLTMTRINTQTMNILDYDGFEADLDGWAIASGTGNRSCVRAFEGKCSFITSGTVEITKRVPTSSTRAFLVFYARIAYESFYVTVLSRNGWVTPYLPVGTWAEVAVEIPIENGEAVGHIKMAGSSTYLTAIDYILWVV